MVLPLSIFHDIAIKLIFYTVGITDGRVYLMIAENIAIITLLNYFMI